MTPSADETLRPPQSGRAVVLTLLALGVAGRAAYLALPVNSDTAMFVYAGKLVAEGGVPGVDLLDNKLPTVGLLLSVPWQWFGAAWAGYAAVGLLLSLVATFFLWRAARDVWGARAGTTVAVASATWLNCFPAAYGALQLEVVQTGFASIAAATVLRLLRHGDARDAAVVGLCAGVAAWAKPTGGAVAAAAVVTLLIAAPWPVWRQVRACGWIVLATLMPVGVAAGLIAGAGMTDGFTQSVRQLHDYAGGSTLDVMDWTKPALVLGLLGLPVAVLGVVFRRDPRASSPTRADVVFVLLWLAAELVGVVSQRRMYAYHFLTLGPPAALAAGLVARDSRPRALAMAFGPFAVASAAWAVLAVAGQPARSREEKLIAYVRSTTPASAAVWADDYPRLLVESGRKPGSAVPLMFLMANGDAAPAFFGHRLLADFDTRRPACVVFPDDRQRLRRLYRHHMADVAGSPTRADGIDRQIDAISAYLAAHYDAGPVFDGQRVWRRKAEPGGAIVRGDDGR